MPNERTLIQLQLSRPREFRTPFQVQSFGYTVTPGREGNRWDCHRKLEFCFRLESTEPYAEDVLDNHVYRNEFPHLFVKLPGVSYHYRIEGIRKAFFLIYPPDAQQAFEAAGLSFEPPGFALERTPEVEEILARLTALFPISQQRGIAEKVDLLGLQLIEEICVRQARERQAREPYEEAIRAIASELQLHPERVPDFDALAAQYSLSRRSFFRYWGKYYEEPPAAYHLAGRMRLAHHLLTDCNRPVAQVAEQLGFRNSSYFVQAYKRYFHTTPSRSRRAEPEG